MYSLQTADLKLRINGAAWESPTVPVLLQILSGASTPQQLMPSGSIIALPRDTVIQLSMPAGVGGGPVGAALISQVLQLILLSCVAPFPSSRTCLRCRSWCWSGAAKLREPAPP